MNNARLANIKIKVRKMIALLLSISLIYICFDASPASAAETPEAVYNGTSLTPNILKNLDLTDVKKASDRIKVAVYETGALEIVKNVNGKTLGLNTYMTREEAIVAVYRLAGKEAAAQKAAETLAAAAAAGTKKKGSLSYWADGAFKLALDDGLITQAQYDDAVTADQSKLTSKNYHRLASAQRQELAYWLAKALKLTPYYEQQKIFNSYKDWKSADATKLPYIETVLRNCIMSGDDGGYFYPKKGTTRSEFAQIAKNAERVVLPSLNIIKNTGTIESKSSKKVVATDKTTTVTTYHVRNSNGRLDDIVIKTPKYVSNSGHDENNGKSIAVFTKEAVVYKNGTLGKSSLLKTGDRLEYIVSPDNTVKFIHVLSSTTDTNYIAAQINSISTGSLTLGVTRLFDMSYPDLEKAKGNLFFTIDESNSGASYKYSKGAIVTDNGFESDISSVTPDSNAILTVKNGVITEIDLFEFENPEEPGIISGIVEDNNPQMGYISLYNEDGTGTDPDDELRTYNYSNQVDVEIYKNHKTAVADAIETGDTVFIRLDSDGEIISMSGIDNYTAKYGKIITKRPETLAVKYDNGAQQVLDVDTNVMVIDNNKPVDYNKLAEGDRVKLLLNITPEFTKIKEITIEGSEHYITGIYKGKVSYINDTSNILVTNNMEVFQNGQWKRADRKGTLGLKISPECKMYYNNGDIDEETANKYYNNNDAYIAVEKDYDGSDLVTVVSFRNEQDAEDVPYDDSIISSDPDQSEITLNGRDESISYGDGTIVVRNGRLVTGSSLTEDDLAYIVANRSYDSGNYYAGIVQISDRPDINFAQIYRTRISKIDENRSFTVQSYSQLEGEMWKYSNTPKTFNLSPGTRIVDDTGVVNQRDFKDYGANSYKDKTVYVIAQGTDTLLISTAPYGTYVAKGEIYDITGGTIGDDGAVITEPTGLNLTDVKLYDSTNFVWNDLKDAALDILINSIIFKDNKIAKPSDLKIGDKIKVLKKDDTETGAAYIIIVEG